MGFNKEEIFKAAKAKIIELEIDRLSNLLGYLPISTKIFYDCFPIGSKEYIILTELTKRYDKPAN